MEREGGSSASDVFISCQASLFSKMFKYEKQGYLRHKETLVSFLSFFIKLFVISLCSGELAACTVHSEKQMLMFLRYRGRALAHRSNKTQLARVSGEHEDLRTSETETMPSGSSATISRGAVKLESGGFGGLRSAIKRVNSLINCLVNFFASQFPQQ